MNQYLSLPLTEYGGIPPYIESIINFPVLVPWHGARNRCNISEYSIRSRSMCTLMYLHNNNLNH